MKYLRGFYEASKCREMRLFEAESANFVQILGLKKGGNTL
jgi:hypothetical protein